MREKVAEILEREVTRINDLSKKSGLDLDEIRKLDLLIKAHKTFSAKEPANDPTDESSPENQPTEALLEELANDESEPSK